MNGIRDRFSAAADARFDPADAAISFEKVSRIFKTRSGEAVEALRDISFTIKKDQFVTIVGPSGCGKSTLLKLVAGLISPSSGRVVVDGSEVRGPGLNVGFVFQRPALLPWRDAQSNVRLPADITRMGRVAAERRAAELLSLVGLSEFAKKYPAELSGGMQQRVAICRALLCNPDLLLMDEPFGALDALTRENLQVQLLRIWKMQPKTVLFVTHSISEAVLLGDHVVVMSARPGRLVSVVKVEIEQPRDLSAMQHPAFLRYVAEIRDAIGTR
jgi:NitT/TauT family transport system ATP-binding protein